MNKIEIEALKNMVHELDLNAQFDNLEAEACNSCCTGSNGGYKKDDQYRQDDDTRIEP